MAQLDTIGSIRTVGYQHGHDETDTRADEEDTQGPTSTGSGGEGGLVIRLWGYVVYVVLCRVCLLG